MLVPCRTEYCVEGWPPEESRASKDSWDWYGRQKPSTIDSKRNGSMGRVGDRTSKWSLAADHFELKLMWMDAFSSGSIFWRNMMSSQSELLVLLFDSSRDAASQLRVRKATISRGHRIVLGMSDRSRHLHPPAVRRNCNNLENRAETKLQLSTKKKQLIHRSKVLYAHANNRLVGEEREIWGVWGF